MGRFWFVYRTFVIMIKLTSIAPFLEDDTSYIDMAVYFLYHLAGRFSLVFNGQVIFKQLYL